MTITWVSVGTFGCIKVDITNSGDEVGDRDIGDSSVCGDGLWFQLTDYFQVLLDGNIHTV